MSDAKKQPAKPANVKRIVVDVAHPGKSAPSSTSKPVLVTNRPIMKDPMVVDTSNEASSDIANDSKTLTATAKIKLTPLTEPTLKPIPASSSEDEAPVSEAVDQPAEKPAESAAESAPAAEAETPVAAEPTEATEEQSTDKSAEPAAAASDKKPDSPPAEKPAPADKKSDDAKPEESQAATNNQTTEDIDAKAAEEAAKHEAAVAELSESKKYYLPVNAVEKRRTKRVVLLGIVLSILLALAWVDVALDAGLIQMSGVKPVTHFFSN